MPVQCIFTFLAGVIVGFVLALSLIVGIALIPLLLGFLLLVMIYAYYRYRREQKKREEILKRLFEEGEDGYLR
ncbi:MAG: hypothetical protein GXN96_06140 [Aquificae bacterium]|nr:hypothetical protein [Aquificota bacterium]